MRAGRGEHGDEQQHVAESVEHAEDYGQRPDECQEPERRQPCPRAAQKRAEYEQEAAETAENGSGRLFFGDVHNRFLCFLCCLLFKLRCLLLNLADMAVRAPVTQSTPASRPALCRTAPRDRPT